MVGGQEDMIIDVAYQLSQRKALKEGVSLGEAG